MSGTELAVDSASGRIGESESGPIRENGNGHIGDMENVSGQLEESEKGHTGGNDSGQMEDTRFPCAQPSCPTMASKKCSRCRAVYYCSRQEALQEKKDCAMTKVISVGLSIFPSSVLADNNAGDNSNLFKTRSQGDDIEMTSLEQVLHGGKLA